MNDLDDLRRKYARVADLRFFDPQDRIWWIYLRAEVEKVVVRHDLPELQAAYDRVKAFPENLPDERARWLELREAVARVLMQWGKGPPASRSDNAGG